MTARRRLSRYEPDLRVPPSPFVEYETGRRVLAMDPQSTAGVRMRSVTIGKQKRLALDPPGVLVSEILGIVEYPFACRPKPRMTWGSRWRYADYFAWVEQVRAFSGAIPFCRTKEKRIDLLLVIRGGLRSNADGANAYKAVEDALCGIAYPDDNIQHVRRGVWSYEDAEVPGFTVILAR